MSGLGENLDGYLALRRSLGHDLADAGRLLPRFVSYLNDRGVTTITTVVALEWALLPVGVAPTTIWSRRMTAVRGFARYMSGIDPATQVPPVGLVPYRQRWKPPFIYALTDIERLFTEADNSIVSPLRRATIKTMLGLLAVTGMRIGEVIRLDRSDIDWETGVILVRETKFLKTRYVPLHPSTIRALTDYAGLRDEFKVQSGNESFFLSLKGKRVIYADFRGTHRRLCTDAGIGAGSLVSPRIHDLRHTFAIETLLRWYRNGSPVQTQVQWLSTYLGHRDPRSTYWYLSAAPELLAFAAGLLETIETSK